MQKPCVFFLAVLVFVVFSVSLLCAQDSSYEKGLQAYLKKDYRSAVKYLKEYVSQNPDAEAYYLLGYANYMVKRKSGPKKGRRNFWGDTETAEYFRQAYLIDPNITPRSIDFKKKSRPVEQ